MTMVFAASACEQASQQDSSERNESGEVVEGGDVGVFRLQEGDCVKLGGVGNTDEVEEVGGFEAVPCDTLHDGEVVLVDDEFFSDRPEFPGDDAASDAATQPCIEALDAYTGTDYESSTYDIFTLVPSDASWSTLDDRGVICVGVTLDDSFERIDTTGSIRVGG
jgi:hypothetical protein